MAAKVRQSSILLGGESTSPQNHPGVIKSYILPDNITGVVRIRMLAVKSH